MNDPGDYYARKERQAHSIASDLSYHRATCHACDHGRWCLIGRNLERELDQARHVGD